MTVDDSDVSTPHREKRIRWLSVGAVLLLLPIDFLASGHRNLKNLANDRELLIAEVPPGGSASYAGAIWRTAAFKVITDGSDQRLAMPPGRALVMVRLAAKVERDVGENWFVCRLTVVDGQGRRWSPLSIALSNEFEPLIEPDGKTAAGCAPVALAQPRAGSEVFMEERFLVPRSALATLEARFSVYSERPRAIAFPLHTR